MKVVGMGKALPFAILLSIANCNAGIGADSTNELIRLNQRIEQLCQEGKHAEALPLGRQALDYAEKNLGPEHRDTVGCLNLLGCLCFYMGEHAEAEPLFQKVLKIRDARLGPEHPDTALILNNLAELYRATGDYAKAEPLHLRALNIREKVFGRDHPATAGSLNNLAELYQGIGDFAKAEQFFQRALKLYEKTSGSNATATADILNNLGVLYSYMGEFTKAEPLLQKALKIREDKFGSDHPDVAGSRNNLAWNYMQTGKLTKAESLYQQALTFYQKALGPDHPATANSLSNLARLYVCMGEYAKAEPLCELSLKINEHVFGQNNPATSENSYFLGLLQFDLGRLDKAFAFAAQYKASSEKIRETILAFTSERQRMDSISIATFWDLFFMATLGNAQAIAESLVRNKGIVLDSLLEDQQVAEASKEPNVKKTVDQLRVVSRKLTQLQLGISENSENNSLEQQVEDLQKTLARNVAAIGQTRRALRTKVSDVQAGLPKNTTLLEFVRYSHYLGKDESEPRYGVVLIGSPQVAFKDAKPGEPVWVPLGPAKAIEQSLKEYVPVMRGARRGEIGLLRTLYAQLFEPIQKRMPKDITTLIISPDAELNFVSFATFINDQDKFLAEQYAIEYVASGRDLVLKRTAPKASRRFAAFANPAFGEKPLMAGAHSTNAVQLAMLSSDQRDYAGVSLGALPNTMQEAQFLRDRSSSWNMDGSVYAGAEATEAEVKAVKSPYILHLATHGFFLPDTLPTNRLAKGRFLVGNERTPTVLHNPMQRSGLAFAGAQLTLDAWKKGQTPNTENDGILMGQEIGTIDLKDTWLVVLSACDTGIGEARAGEGVLGLRRGFIQAGTQNLLMTLWPVSDKYTVDLMKAFYERALKDNNAPQALAQVQRDFLVKIRKEKNAVLAARLAGPFVMTFQGRN